MADLQERLPELAQFFIDAEEYFRDRADADLPHGAIGPIPNDEMRLLYFLQEAQKELADALDAAEAEIARLTELTGRLRQEAEAHAQEARAQRATVHEIYQVVSGATGERGDWHGAEPVKELIARLTAEMVDKATAWDEIAKKNDAIAKLHGALMLARKEAWNEAIEAAALVASLQALKMPKKRTTRLGLPREPYAHEYGNLISNAIRELFQSAPPARGATPPTGCPFPSLRRKHEHRD